MKRPPPARGRDRIVKAPTAQTAPAPGAGQSLPSPLLQHMQHAMGHDFSSVRVHTDAGATALTRSLGAAAVTRGRDIAFAPGHYRPSSRQGLSLLAHELTHVAQPKAANLAGVAPADHPSEREADRVADTVAAGGRAVPQAQAGGALQRQPLPGAEQTPGGSLLPPLGGTSLLDDVSPLMASLMGSTTLEVFAVGSSELAAEDRSSVKFTAYNITTLLKQYPLSTLRVTGYADGAATTLEAGALAQGRANAVQAALIDAGVPAAMIAAHGSSEASPGGKGRVEVRFEPKRMFGVSLMPGLDFRAKQSAPLPFANVKPTLQGLPGLGGLPGIGNPLFPQTRPGPWRNPQAASPALQPPGPATQPQSSGLPSLDLDLTIGPVTIKLPKEVRAKLPLALSRATSLVFDLSYEAPAKFGLKIALDGTPHVTVSLKGGAEYDVKDEKATASAGLVIDSNRKVFLAEDPIALREKTKTSGEKLNKAAKEFSAATTPEDRLSKAMDIAGAIGEIYEAVDKSKKPASEVPQWSLEFGYKGLIDPGKETDPAKWPPAHYFGATFTWRFGSKKK
jgi:outer membrane protein OmpA-like peptidoglycan-associated protein